MTLRSCIGARPYEDAYSFSATVAQRTARQWVTKTHLSSEDVLRTLGCLCALLNFALLEHGLCDPVVCGSERAGVQLDHREAFSVSSSMLKQRRWCGRSAPTQDFLFFFFSFTWLLQSWHGCLRLQDASGAGEAAQSCASRSAAPQWSSIRHLCASLLFV